MIASLLIVLAQVDGGSDELVDVTSGASPRATVDASAGTDFLYANSVSSDVGGGATELAPELTNFELGLRARAYATAFSRHAHLDVDYQGRQPIAGTSQNSTVHLLYKAEVSADFLDKMFFVGVGRFLAPSAAMLAVDGLRAQLHVWKLVLQAFGGRRAMTSSLGNVDFANFLPALGGSVTLALERVQAEAAVSYTRDEVPVLMGTAAPQKFDALSAYLRATGRPLDWLALGGEVAMANRGSYLLGPTWTTIALRQRTIDLFYTVAFVELRPVKTLRVSYHFHLQNAAVYREGITQGGDPDFASAPQFMDHRVRVRWRPFDLGWLGPEARFRMRPDRDELRVGGFVDLQPGWARGLGLRASYMYEKMLQKGAVLPPSDRSYWVAALCFRRGGLDISAGASDVQRAILPLSGRVYTPYDDTPLAPADLSPFVLESQRLAFVRAFYSSDIWYAGLDFEQSLSDGRERRVFLQLGARLEHEVVTPLALALLLVCGQAWKASTAPGPSSKAHEKIEGDCDSCHLPFKGLPNEKCLGCHKGLKAFHTSVAAQKCVACHLEHKGPAANLTRPAAQQSFDHALTGVPLVGGHAKVQCKTCHTKKIEQMSQACGSCHKDTHQGALGANCTACHDSKAWKPALKTLAQHKTSTEGGHQGLKCEQCHLKGKALAASVQCAACHERAHGGTTAPCEGCHVVAAWKPAKFDHSFCTCQLPQKHQTVGCLGCHRDFNFTSAPSLCSGCHEKERKHEPLGECSLCHSAVSWKKNQFDHNKKAKMKLVGAHLKVACEQCHPPAGKAMKFRGLPLQCEGCHQKQGDKAHGNFGPCLKCHDNDAFKPSSFDHATTGFPLVGRHGKLNCKECHENKVKGYPKRAELLLLKNALAWSPGTTLDEAPPLPSRGEGRGEGIERLSFTSAECAERSGPSPCPSPREGRGDAWMIAAATPTHGKESTCSHCHKDPHQGSTKAEGECSSCHGNDAWKPATFTTDRHKKYFELTGKHLTTSCSLCHTEKKFDDAPKACSSCHLDRHHGQLGLECGKCHSTTAFKPVTNFDHAITGFQLAGKHAAVSCASCHEGKRGTALNAAKETKTAGACTTCHTAQHGNLGNDCLTCHDPTSGPFAKARGMSFAHAATGFPLERRHQGLACGACHKANKPSPQPACGSCHSDPHSGQLSRFCEDCHAPDRWRLAKFDHDRSGWPLRGKHFVTPCLQCHVAQRWVGLPTDCWDCHAADAARGRLREPQKHGLGPIDCAGCHSSGWRW